MTMFEFMQNAFFLLCGIICIAAAVLVMCVDYQEKELIPCRRNVQMARGTFASAAGGG